MTALVGLLLLLSCGGEAEVEIDDLAGEWTIVVYADDAETGDRLEFDEVTFTVE